jgi:SAM-dependent methyltransferase
VDRDSGTSYADEFADVYDVWFGGYLGTAPAADRLAALAASVDPGPILELGIGTGRVALPLAELGLDVHGIDASPAMVAQLRAKPGGDRIPVVLGDFSEVAPDGEFALVYVVAGTFFELQSQEAQVRCFRNVARHLRPDGLFAMDALLPDASRSAGDQDIRMIPTDDDRLMVRFRNFDPAEQRYSSHYLVVHGGTARHVRVAFRYAWPSELDLMARLAGLRLRERTGTWRGEPFTSSSRSHVSVYERDPEPLGGG